MGNDISQEVPLKGEGEDFAQFLKQRKKKQSQQIQRTDKYTFSPELKWRGQLVQSLQTLGKNKAFAQLSQDLIDVVKKIKMENYIKAISVLNAMNNPEVLELNSKQVLKESFNYDFCRQSTHVFIDIEPRFQNSGYDSVATDYSMGSPDKSRVRKSLNNSKKSMSSILVREFNQQQHPVRLIKESFMVIFQMKFREKLNELYPLDDKKRQNIQIQMHKDLKFYCEFMANGCSIYKKWIVKYSKLREDKYMNFMKGVIMDSLFSGQSFHSFIFPLLKQLSTQPVEDMMANIPDKIGVDCFHIKHELQIDGNFVHSLMTLQDIDRLTSPKRLLDNFQHLKDQICNDIDQFHQLFKTDKSYKIDGDNLLGIVCFLLCRLKPKLPEIYTQIMLLNVVYGDSVNLVFETASYMVTAIQASFDHFVSPQFLEKSVLLM